MALIDPLAIVHPSAQLGAGVEVGPWTVIGPDVHIGEGTVIHSHVVIKGPTWIGKHNRIFQFATVGEATPDMKYQGEPTRLVMGDHNTVREGATIHRGTVQDRGETSIGHHNLIMAYVHIGHDCVLGDHIILINNASMAGHVKIGDWAFLSGFTMIHQHVCIGAHAFVGPAAFVNQDVPTYVMATGHPAKPRTINKVGLQRRGFTAAQVIAINRAYKALYRQGLKLEEALERVEAIAAAGSEEKVAIEPLLESVRTSARGIIR
ncbi:MAG: acyl-ACP--UDP-N-acetylglucosamine O-acyltransferase [Porticoccaceae bacterium]